MNFRNRLALFLMAILFGVQAATAIFAYAYLRHTVVEQGKRELSSATDAFMRQLNFLSERVTDGVQVLALDYPLRAAIARHDEGTEYSVLRNHGRRIGAARMMLVGLDGRLEADSDAPARSGSPFPFAKLLREAAEQDSGTALGTIGDSVYWIVVVPVRAPVPIAFIAAFIPVDGTLLDKLRGISSSPHAIMLSVAGPRGSWSVAAHSSGSARASSESIASPSEGAAIVSLQGEEYLASSARLNVTSGSRPVVATLDYPLEETLREYRGLFMPMLLLLAFGLAATVAGTAVIVRHVVRPLEELAESARRIASGDYTHPPQVNQRDEVGHLADALVNMTHSIAEREQALKSAVGEAEQSRAEAVRANEAKSQFLANMSHEFRTPLNAIVGFSEMVQRQVLGPVGIAKYLDYAGDIHDSGRRLLQLVERMLDLAEAESNQLVLALKPVSVGVLLLEAANLHRGFAGNSGVRIDVPAGLAEWPQIEGDAAKLGQAFANLIHNAIKFTPSGGEVRISGNSAGARIAVSISDTGIGVEPSQIDAVVRPFHRLRSAIDGQHQGAGLGLPFAKVIVELHGGTFAISSTVGVGTTVSIELPVNALRNAA
jgi:signal transduction histidine kinase